LNFDIVSDFDIRISDLLALSPCHSGQAKFPGSGENNPQGSKAFY